MHSEQPLQFNCLSCFKPISFTLLNDDPLNDYELESLICCDFCGKKYLFEEESILDQLKLFEALCRQIHASKKILGTTAIAIDVGNHHVKVPFNILLTKLNSVIELSIGDQRVTFSYRIEPLKETAVRELSAAH